MHLQDLPAPTAIWVAPAARQVMPLPGGTADAAAVDAAAAAARSAARIVVIADEPLTSQALDAFLRSIGHTRVSLLAGPAVGAERLRDERPDVLLIDLGTQQPEPFALLQCLREHRLLRLVPVLAMAAAGDPEGRLRALELGAADVLATPIAPRELALRLRNLLAAKAERDELENTDRLTGLPNREAALARLDAAIQHALRHGTVGAALQLGIDRFAEVNDALGPTVSDDLLRSVAQRVQLSLRGSDTLARDTGTGTGTRSDTLARDAGTRSDPCGNGGAAGGKGGAAAAAQLSRGSGHEFTVLLPVLERAEDAAVVARRILERMAQPFQVAGFELFVGCRIGMAVFPTDGAHRDTVLKQAGAAMRHVGEGGAGGPHGSSDAATGSGYRFFSQELQQRCMQRLGLERDLRLALERGEFVLHFQPQVDVSSGRLCGAEALVRWLHPQRGLVPPGDFIGVAEESGLIGELGRWVLRQALAQLAAWRAAGLALPLVSVNVSSLQLTGAGFVQEVAQALADAAVPGASLCLELTESVMMGSGAEVGETLRALKALGVSLALDDFGTGFSSLTHLRNFPLDELKVDRSFVTGCESDVNNGAITAAIIAMAHRLGLRVVAEGVETPRELAFVRGEGCDSFQGYLFARPLPAPEFGALLGARPAAAAPPAPARKALQGDPA